MPGSSALARRCSRSAKPCGDGTDLMILTPNLGKDLAKKLGKDAAVVLMRGHGDSVVGPSLPNAVFRAYYTEVQCAPATCRDHDRRSDQLHDARRGDHLERGDAACLGAALGAMAQAGAGGALKAARIALYWGVLGMLRLCVADLDSPSYFIATAAIELRLLRGRRHRYRIGAQPMARSTGRSGCAAATCTSSAVRPTWRPAPFPAGRAQSCCARWRNIPIGFWRCAPILTSSAAISMRSRVCAFHRRRHFPKSGCVTCCGRRASIWNGIGFRSCRCPAPRTSISNIASASRRSSQNIADAYWGNGMRLAIGEKLGLAKLHLDLRRGDGPPGARFYNFAALTTTERLIEEQPEIAAGAVRAIVKAQKALKADPSRATAIGERLFAPEAAVADRRPHRPRCAVLRCDDFAASRRRHQRIRDGQWPA